MPRKEAKKKNKSQNEHFETIEILLGSLLLERKPTLAEVAKLIGVRKDRFIGAPHGRKDQDQST
jgi:hypothetical protein